MKKSKIKPKEYLKDLKDVLDIVNKIDNINLESTDLKVLNNILKNQKIKLKNKYKDLDSEE